MSKLYSTVYMPTRKGILPYLPYFRYEDDENIEDCHYLLKDVKIDLEEKELVNSIIRNIEGLYNFFDSEGREEYEKLGLKFEYRLNEDQTSSYYLVLDEHAKEFISKATLNISSLDGEFDEMILATASGTCYADVDMVNMVDKEGKAFIKELVDKGLLKKKRVRVYEQSIDLEDIVDVE